MPVRRALIATVTQGTHKQVTSSTQSHIGAQVVAVRRAYRCHDDTTTHTQESNITQKTQQYFKTIWYKLQGCEQR